METQNLMRKSHVHLTLWKFEIDFQLSHGVEGLIMVGILGKYGFKPSRAASELHTKANGALRVSITGPPTVGNSLAKLTRRPQKADQMAVNKGECLLLTDNKKTVQWCLERWRKSSGVKSKDAVCFFQNAAIYYAGSGIRRSGKMNVRDRNEKVVESYKHFVVKAWLKYLVEQHDFTPPAWLTIQLMSSINIGGALVLFRPR